MLRDHTIQPRPAVDSGKTIQQIDQELRELSDATLERYAAAHNLAETGAKRFEALDEYQKKAARAANEIARRTREKEQAAAKAADDAKFESQQNTVNQAKIDAYRQQVRGAFIGTKEDFEREWPRLLSDWQRDQARTAIDADMVRHRARMGDLL